MNERSKTETYKLVEDLKRTAERVDTVSPPHQRPAISRGRLVALACTP